MDDILRQTVARSVLSTHGESSSNVFSLHATASGRLRSLILLIRSDSANGPSSDDESANQSTTLPSSKRLTLAYPFTPKSWNHAHSVSRLNCIIDDASGTPARVGIPKDDAMWADSKSDGLKVTSTKGCSGEPIFGRRAKTLTTLTTWDGLHSREIELPSRVSRK